MKIDDLKLLVKVVELGSFTAAANALDLPRANVSRRINTLETDIGVPMFHRTTRSLSLTHQGEAYYQELRQILERFDSLNQTIVRDTNTLKGKVKFGILPETHDLLQPILFEFLDRHPEVEVDIRVIQNGFIDMYQQGLDFAFHGGALVDSDLVARQVLQLDRCLVASPQYIEQFGEPKSVSDIAQHHALCFRWPTGEVDQEWPFSNESVRVQSKFIANSVAFIKDATLKGRGIAFLPKVLVKQQLSSGELVPLLTDQVARNEHGYLLYPQPKTLSHVSRQLIEHLLAEIPKLN
ncbi:LysR family transcriptional regulator [Vibrio sp. LaRot3]|uniref:LysR family transcriptional regulator n=1 Tax=Vibrio sp. LaRot3 TaxID=2998829 RepID=UPI0022CE0F1C|nr:LysR family transcriptional regulator [Vibrio sp. LaRot3]MDA0148287.1 LysR family transcriptional regulator [Vibrio sp. LaRot3]